MGAAVQSVGKLTSSFVQFVIGLTKECANMLSYAQQEAAKKIHGAYCQTCLLIVSLACCMHLSVSLIRPRVSIGLPAVNTARSRFDLQVFQMVTKNCFDLILRQDLATPFADSCRWGTIDGYFCCNCSEGSVNVRC